MSCSITQPTAPGSVDVFSILKDGVINCSQRIYNSAANNGYLFVQVISSIIPVVSGSVISFSNTLNGYNIWCPQILITESVFSFTPANALNGLSDTNIISPTDGNILMYNSTSNKWENKLSSDSIANIVTLSTPQTIISEKIFVQAVSISKNATFPSIPLSLSNSQHTVRLHMTGNGNLARIEQDLTGKFSISSAVDNGASIIIDKINTTNIFG